ncbi:MAG: four helix bundle protein [Candidatus Neomarinimicrobiota bacterium]|nr:MAG: four helix bundle protein [Candidatus Neomarinimicrobiota bacterium]
MIVDKSFAFSVKIVNLVHDLKTNKKDYVISNQLLRSGTSIGANVYEAQCAASRKDFNNKLTIALKEANETHYWLKLINESQYLLKLNIKKTYQQNTQQNSII